MEEKWKQLKGYEGFYEISTSGRIKSVERIEIAHNRWGAFKRKRKEMIMKTCFIKDRETIELNKNNEIKKCFIYRLVYENFVGEIPNGYVVHHKDFNKRNNSVSNLQAMDYFEHNRIHAHPAWNKGIRCPESMIKNAALGRKKTYYSRCLTTYDLYTKGLSFRKIASQQNISLSTVTNRIKQYKEYLEKNNEFG